MCSRSGAYEPTEGYAQGAVGNIDSALLRARGTGADTSEGFNKGRSPDDSAATVHGGLMRFRRTRVADRKSLARSGRLAALVFVALVSISIATSGCGQAPLRAQTAAQSQAPAGTQAQSQAALVSQTPSAEAAQPTAATNVTHTTDLHEKVMAEQGRGPGMTAPSIPTITTTVTTEASPPASTPVSTPADPSPKKDGLTTVVLTGGQTPLKGTWGGTAERLASFLLKACPSPHFTVPTSVLAGYYVRYCADAGLRADLLWAQMIHETGYGMYGGAVAPDQNNFAGIGATGNGEPGVVFTTAEAGVMAQVAHMVAYVYASSPVAWANETVDPRFDLVDPRGIVTVLSDLDGRWAVPGTGYGEAVEAIARAINAD